MLVRLRGLWQRYSLRPGRILPPFLSLERQQARGEQFHSILASILRMQIRGEAVRFGIMKSKGTVYLVGAGPGDAGLLTLRGAELLKRAEVVVYDALVNKDLLRLAPKNAEIIYGGKRAKDHAIPQDELNALLISKATEGKTVVRLKGGDPYIFGRG